MKATKKPVTIDFVKWDGKQISEVTPWIKEAMERNINQDPNSIMRVGSDIHIKLVEGNVVIAYPGDYIICGVKGEIYPCKPDIFEATYVIGENAVEEEQNPMKQAFDIIKNDPELRMAYVANIAMAFKDHYTRYKKRHDYKDLPFEDLHIISNTAAEYFMDLLLKDPGEGMPVTEEMKLASVGSVYPSSEETVYSVKKPGDIAEGGAHEYLFRESTGFSEGKTNYVNSALHLRFVHKLPSGEVIPGVQSEQLAICLLDRVKKLDKAFPCDENKDQIAALEAYLRSCKQRIDNRISRGVMGELKK